MLGCSFAGVVAIRTRCVHLQARLVYSVWATCVLYVTKTVEVFSVFATDMLSNPPVTCGLLYATCCHIDVRVL